MEKEIAKIKVKSIFHGWCEASEEQALKWARHKWRSSIGRFREYGDDPMKAKLAYINSKIQGVQFTLEQLR